MFGLFGNQDYRVKTPGHLVVEGWWSFLFLPDPDLVGFMETRFLDGRNSDDPPR